MTICICKSTTCIYAVPFLQRRHLPNIHITFGTQQMEALIDTGAMVPLLDNDCCQAMLNDDRIKLKFTNKSIVAFGCSGTQLDIKGSVIGQLYFHSNDSPILAEFYLLQGASQNCIIPHPWLEALHVVIDYNTLSLKYELPVANRHGYLLTAEGDLELTKSVGKDFDMKGDHDDHTNDDDDEDDNDNDNDKNDDESDHDDNDDPKDTDVTCVNREVDLTRTARCQKLLFTIPAKKSNSCFLTCSKQLRKKALQPGFLKLDNTLTASIKIHPNQKPMLTIYNDSDRPVTVDLAQLKFTRSRRRNKLLPIKINRWTVNMLAVDEIDRTTERFQSTFCTQSKSLDNLPLDSEKIPFTIPADIKGHPFTEATSSLTILHVYLLHLLGSNFKYMLKSKDELKQIILNYGSAAHHRAQITIQALYEKAKIQEMYSKYSTYIVGLVHSLFLDVQRRQYQIENNPQSNQTNRLKKFQLLNRDLVSRMKAITALFFLNQKLINEFFETTMQHPYFQQLTLPASFKQTLTKLGLSATDSQNKDNNNDNDKNDDKQDNKHDDPGKDVKINSVMLHPPVTLPNKNSLSQYISEAGPIHEPQQLNFRQYCDFLSQTCNSISDSQEVDARRSKFSSKQPNLAEFSPHDMKSFIQYSKTPRRLMDFIEDQIPDLGQPKDKLSVEQLLETIPPPRWTIYQSEDEILNDYIPRCLRDDFEIFYAHFRDPVFIKYASLFPLPYPPNRSLSQADPPDPLHSDSGLVDPKTLANAVCQFLSYDHPLVTNPMFTLELLQLSCVLYLFGQFNVSLHAMDTGWFRRELEVKTLLAPTAPTSSFPSKQATENVSEDLDERIDYLMQQGKAQIILGSPFLAQITSIPKNYKTGRVIHSTQSDPVLAYISGLSETHKTQLSKKSEELTNHQRSLIQSLENTPPSNPEEMPDCVRTSGVDEKVTVSVVTCNKDPLFGPLTDPSLACLHIHSFGLDHKGPKTLLLESSTPPTSHDKVQFLRLLKTKAKTRPPLKVKFGKVYTLTLINTDDDISDRLSFINHSRFQRNYFISVDQGKKHTVRYSKAAVGTHSKRLLGPAIASNQEVFEDRSPVQYLANYPSNIAQLARHQLDLDWAKNQQFLANVNNVHFCIEQMSSHAIYNMIPDDDPNYEVMRQFAQDPRYLLDAHISNNTNSVNQSLVQFCYNVTLDKSNQAKLFEESKLFGNIYIPHQGSQLFSDFVNCLITGMRRLDHKQPLKASHEERRNVLDIIHNLDPSIDTKSKDFDFKSITLKQMVDKFENWEGFVNKIASHYQIPAVWLFTEVNQHSRYKQDIIISKVVISNKHLYNPIKGEFIISAINTHSAEYFRVRPNTDICKILIQGAQDLKWAHSLELSEISRKLETYLNSSLPSMGQTAKPRYTKVKYDHLDKSFYQKNAIHRIIHCSKDTNKLTRPILSRAVQSQGDVLKNLGSSELFSNYDLTSAYDAVPADSISTLINCVSYRNREYAFLCASQGGSNSVLFCQRAVTSIMHKIKDQMVLQDCFLPRSIKDIAPELQQQFDHGEKNGLWTKMSSDISWLCQPNLLLPGPQLIKSAQKALLCDPKSSTDQHILPLSLPRRRELLMENKEDCFIASTALVDDLVTSSKAVDSELYSNMSENEKLQLHFKIHIYVLLSIFSAINALSVDPGPGPKFKSTLKLRLEKSVFAATSLRYLNTIYLRGHKTIDLQNFKRSVAYITEAPATGDELRSAIGFFSFLLNFVPNLRFHLKKLNALAETYPAKKSIMWENHPKIKESYFDLCKVIQSNTALHTLPDDLSQIHKYVMNSDSCNASLSYLIGIILCSDVLDSNRPQNIRPIKYYSVKLPEYCLNLVILLKEIIGAVMAILQELPQIKLLPPSCHKAMIVDSKPLFDILAKFQRNGYLDSFFTSHVSVPLWLNRLYQLLVEHEIQLYLMPTKNAPPADFLTRKDPKDPEFISCQSSVTNKRVKCDICPGCKLHCIRKGPHSGCPLSIGASPDKEPNILKPDIVETKTIIVDNKEIQFQDNQMSIQWEKYEKADLGPILANSCYSQYLQNLSEDNLMQLASDDFQYDQMISQYTQNLERIKIGQQSVNKLFDEAGDAVIKADSNVSGKDVCHKYDDKNDDENDDHGDDEYHCEHVHDDHDKISCRDDTPCQSSTNNYLFCNQSETHICYQQNLTIIREYFPRKPHSFKFPVESVLIMFVTQKKKWHLPISYAATLLNDTAAANLTFNPGQLQEIILDGTKYLILCVSTDAQKKDILSTATLLPNLQRCLKHYSPCNIFYDANSMMNSYQCHPNTVIQAIQIIARFHPAHHCIYFSHNVKLFNPPFPWRHLQLDLTLIHNGQRHGVLSLEIEASPNFAVTLESFRNQIRRQINIQLPLLAETVTRETGLVKMDGQVIALADMSVPLDISKVSLILVKDSQIIKCEQNVRGNYSAITNINLMNMSDHSLRKEILYKTGKTYQAFSVQLNTPLRTEFYPSLLSLYKNHSHPTFDTQLSLLQFKQMCDTYPEISSIKLVRKHPLSPTDLNQNTSVNNVQLTEVPSSELLRQFLGDYTVLFISQSNDNTIQKLISQVRSLPNGQLIMKNSRFQLFDNILYGKQDDKECFKPVLPDARVVPLILTTHARNCAPPKRVVRKIRQRFCHILGITSNMSLDKTASSLLPCFKCLTMTPAHVSAPLSMQFKSIGLQAQGRKICTYVALDVFYLADANSRVYKNNFISIILCQSCKFIHLKPISRISSHNLAQHLLEFVRLTGRIPTVIISDAASTNLFGEMKKLLNDFYLIHIQANYNILNVEVGAHDDDEDNDGNGHDDHKDDRHENDVKSDHDNDGESVGTGNFDGLHPNLDDRYSNQKPQFKSTPLQLISPAQKKFLLQDLRNSSPPLFPPVLRHTPISYKATQSTRQTSLGSLDHVCKRLQIFLKKFLNCLPNSKDFKAHAEFLVASFEYQNNFCLQADSTKIIPAQLHLGAVNTTNILNLMTNIERSENTKSQQIQNMQELLRHAKTIQEAKQNSILTAANRQRRQLNEHGKVKHPGDIQAEFKPLDVLFIKTELQDEPKMSLFVKFHGPCVVLSVHPISEHINLYGLLSGEVLTKNFKQVKFAFSKEIFSLPLFPHLGNTVQFRMVTPRSKIRDQDSAENILMNSTKVIVNCHKLMLFLSSLLPSHKDTMTQLRTIEISVNHDEADKDENNDEQQNDDDNLLTIYKKPSVRFEPQDPICDNVDENDDHGDDDHNQDDHNQDEDHHDDDHDQKNIQPQLHTQAPASDNLINQSPQIPQNELVPRRPKIVTPELTRRSKYALRQNPRKTRKMSL